MSCCNDVGIVDCIDCGKKHKTTLIKEVKAHVSTGINPKDIAGSKKPNMALIPQSSMLWVAKSMEDGANKYGPYNWREEDKPVQSMPYISAIMRHTAAYLDGEDFAPDSKLPHLAHIAATCLILLDATIVGNLIDNRPRRGKAGQLLEELKVKE